MFITEWIFTPVFSDAFRMASTSAGSSVVLPSIASNPVSLAI
jgi:hypothetical protein